ncbi:MAG: hypothetical protein AAFV45_05315 [Pseudomonadota bacterium]
MKFILGLVFGAVMSFAYVRYNVELPTVLQLPGLVQNAAVVSAIDADLYNLEATPRHRQRALEVYFQAQPKQAAQIDWEAGSPFLNALHKRWATRQARQLKGQWTAFEVALEKPELRKVLERAHGTSDPLALKQAMLWKAYGDEPFLQAWLARHGGPVTQKTLYGRVVEAAKGWPVRM